MEHAGDRDGAAVKVVAEGVPDPSRSERPPLTQPLDRQGSMAQTHANAKVAVMRQGTLMHDERKGDVEGDVGESGGWHGDQIDAADADSLGVAVGPLSD